MMALRTQGKIEEADLLLLRAIRIQEMSLGLDNPALAASLGSRARVLHAQVKHNHCLPGNHRRVVQYNALLTALHSV